MKSPQLRNNWMLGINNKDDWRRLANGQPIAGQPNRGAVREAVNVNANSDGTLSLRAGYEQIYSGTAVRGVLALGTRLLIADGGQLLELDLVTNSTRLLRAIDDDGAFVGDVLNGELFFCTASETLRYDGQTVRAWGVPTVTTQPLPSIVGGGMPAGSYQCAVTLVNAQGEEGGTVRPLVMTVPEGSGLSFTLPEPPPGGAVRVYVGSREGSTLYLQDEANDSLTITSVHDNGARLETFALREPVVAQSVIAYNGTLLAVNGSTISMTLPMRPHLRNSLGYVQFPDVVDVAVPVASEGARGLFVAAGDQTFFLTNLETDDINQVTPKPYGAVPGTAVCLPNGGATWMTRYGQAVGQPDGSIALLSADRFVPESASSGTSGVLEHDGQQIVVTATRGASRPSSLAASDYYISEIITHEPPA